MSNFEKEDVYECPNECGHEIEKKCEVCPSCKTDIVFCDRGNHMVLKSIYDKSNDLMCKVCWNEMDNKAD